MKKRMLLGLLQYGLALLMIAITVIYILAYAGGKLPFMTEEYLALREEAGVAPSVSEPPVVEEDSVAPMEYTAQLFVSGLDPYNGGGFDSAVYDDNVHSFVRLPMTALGDLGGSNISLQMGYVCVESADGTRRYYAPGERLAAMDGALGDAIMAFVRDEQGRPLFYNNGYYYYSDKKLIAAEYDKINSDKGVSYYPAYEASYDKSYKVYESGGRFGMKGVDGVVIVNPVYKDVYGVSDNRIVAVGEDNKLYVYDTKGNIISDGLYFAPETDGEEAVGCFFYKNGLTRAYTAEGKSVLLDKDGKVLTLPGGFEVGGYSDGVMLLKQRYINAANKEVTAYGYMDSEGRWIYQPDCTDAKPFYEGLGAVCNSKGLWGMVDKAGNQVIPCVFDSISNCEDGVVLAYSSKYGNFMLGKVS